MYAMAGSCVGMDACTGLGKVTVCPLGKWSAIQYSAVTILDFFTLADSKHERGRNDSF